ncbi:MAG: hypothetical protein J2P14_16135, partial [Acidothermales bacterium]|nr:hypothetical protein [Acidothermales bacterium]
VRARLARPTRWRRGRLHTSVETAGVSSVGSTALQHHSCDELRDELRSALTLAVTAPVDR